MTRHMRYRSGPASTHIVAIGEPTDSVRRTTGSSRMRSSPAGCVHIGVRCAEPTATSVREIASHPLEAESVAACTDRHHTRLPVRGGHDHAGPKFANGGRGTPSIHSRDSSARLPTLHRTRDTTRATPDRHPSRSSPPEVQLGTKILRADPRAQVRRGSAIPVARATDRLEHEHREQPAANAFRTTTGRMRDGAMRGGSLGASGCLPRFVLVGEQAGESPASGPHAEPVPGRQRTAAARPRAGTSSGRVRVRWSTRPTGRRSTGWPPERRPRPPTTIRSEERSEEPRWRSPPARPGDAEAEEPKSAMWRVSSALGDEHRSSDCALEAVADGAVAAMPGIGPRFARVSNPASASRRSRRPPATPSSPWSSRWRAPVPAAKSCSPRAGSGRARPAEYFTARAASSGRKAVTRRPLAASITPGGRTRPRPAAKPRRMPLARSRAPGWQNTSCGTIARPRLAEPIAHALELPGRHVRAGTHPQERRGGQDRHRRDDHAPGARPERDRRFGHHDRIHTEGCRPPRHHG